METGFLNGEKRSPGVYVKFGSETHLFDCGRASYEMDLVKPLTNVYISHTHMDHFLGFDEIVGLKQHTENKRITVFGPNGITNSVRSKIKAYTWNLAGPGAVLVDICELDKGRMTKTSLSISDDLEGKVVDKIQLTGDVIHQTPNYRIRFVELNHGIPSLGYVFEEYDRVGISKEALAASNLRPGPWLEALKAQAEKETKHPMHIGGKQYQFDELSALLETRKGKRVVYVTDFVFEDGTIEKVAQIAKDADILYCESNHSSADVEIARKNHHLTASQAAEIAKACNVGELVLMHFSQRYDSKQLIAEAAHIFEKVR